MPEFFVLAGRDLGKRFDLEEGAILGRGEDSSALLRDASVSRSHARLEREGPRWFLVDLGSRNGMRVGEEKLERVELVDELEVQLGKIPLRVRLGSSVATEEPRPASPPAQATPTGGDGFVIEDEIELGAVTEEMPPGKGAARGEEHASARAPAKPPGGKAEADSEREAARARILRASEPAGLFSSELSQLPLALRWTIYLLVAVAAGALFWAVVRTVLFLRST